MKTFQLIIEKNQDGYWGQFMEYPTVFTHGATIDTILHNAREALELYFEEIRHPPKRIDISIVMDLVHFFEVNDFINITKLAERTGMNASLLRQYARGIKYPGLRQVEKIEQTVREIGAQLVKTELTDRQLPIGLS